MRKRTCSYPSGAWRRLRTVLSLVPVPVIRPVRNSRLSHKVLLATNLTVARLTLCPTSTPAPIPSTLRRMFGWRKKINREIPYDQSSCSPFSRPPDHSKTPDGASRPRCKFHCPFVLYSLGLHTCPLSRRLTRPNQHVSTCVGISKLPPPPEVVSSSWLVVFLHRICRSLRTMGLTRP